MEAWHFVGDTLRDGRPVPPDGEWLEHCGEIVWGKSGLYASRRALDALTCAEGATACRVECEDIEIDDEDKFVCRRRRILWRVDATAALRAFARTCALDVLHLWNPPDVVPRYLRTGEEGLRDAAGAAAWDAAGDAAWATAWAAAWDAAWVAARAAARAAAGGAAGAAARDTQNATLERILDEAHDGRTEWVVDMEDEA